MKKIILATALSLAASSVFAGGPIYPYSANVTSSGSNYQTKGYVGLNWSLGGSLTPAMVLGVVNVKTKSNGDTTGADLAFKFDLFNGFAPGTLKLSYLNGNNHTQGVIGGGYDFAQAAPILGLGVNGNYYAGAVDLNLLNRTINPNVSLTTLEAFDQPNNNATSCAAGDTLFNGSCYGAI